MIKFIDMSGKTEEEAVSRALAQLGLDRDDVSVEILERAKSGFFGIGSAPATVRVSYDDGQEEPKPEVKAAPKAEVKEPQKVRKPEETERQEKVEKKPERMVFQPEILQRETRAKEKTERPAPAPKQEKTPSVHETKEQLGEETHDEKSEQIRAFLSGLLSHMDSSAQIRVYESEKGRYKVILEGEKLGGLIGRRGETLDAIQQLTNYSVNRSSEKGRIRVQIDAENYREKREESLERLAQKVAQKVIRYRRNVTLEPMNAYERHVIHTALQSAPNVTTFSIGTEPNRRVIVSYDRNKQV